ncbi:MAG TPA: LPS export ABC transporter permease LptF [Sulfuricaulis sp.]|nr:LPS export ABC transporter permease LptF [Sulfuricaulis sp.]
MIINRAFYREAAMTTLAIGVVLLVVMVLMSLSFLLGRAVRGDQSRTVVFILLGFQTLSKLDVLLPLAFYLGILLTLSRWYRDSEMTVLAACGVGLMHFMRPVMVLGLVFGALALAGAFYFTPFATRQIEQVKLVISQRSEPASIYPGVFLEAPGTGRIVYAEKIEENGGLQGIFVSSLEEGKQGVLVAKSGYPYTDPKTGDKFIALQNGTLYEGEPGEAGYRILEYSVYSLRIVPTKIGEAPVPTAGLPTLKLLTQLADRNINAEFHWRLGKTIALFVLALYAVVLAYTDVRRGRMSNLFVAIVVYFIYSNLLGIGETLLQNGRMPAAAGLWWVHIGMALVALYFLRQRAHDRTLLSLPAGVGRR